MMKSEADGILRTTGFSLRKTSERLRRARYPKNSICVSDKYDKSQVNVYYLNMSL